MERRRYVLSLLIGLAAGAAGGLFGIGGGILVVPGLVLLLGMLPHRAHPTSVTAIVVVAAAALARFAGAGAVDWPSGTVLFAGAGLGALLGAAIVDRISARWLTRAFVVALLVSAVRLLLTSAPEAGAPFVDAIDISVSAGLGLLAAGLVAGLVAATLGVGGGIVFVPTLAVLFVMDQHVAQGTSLAAMVPTTLVAAAAHGRAGRVDWRIAAWVGVGGIAGGLSGAGLALSLDPLLLRRLFAGLLILVAVRMLLQGRRRADRRPAGEPAG